MEADSGGETEAGTTQRDVVRLGVVNIAVSFSVSPKWLKLLTGFKQQEKDTSYKGLWTVGFTLKEI